MPSNHSAHAIGRRWLDLSELPDGNFQIAVMLNDRPLATLVFETGEFANLRDGCLSLLPAPKSALNPSANPRPAPKKLVVKKATVKKAPARKR